MQGFNKIMLWKTLCTVVVQFFLAVGIANHSLLSGAYSKFLLKNSQLLEVVVMKRKLERMEVKVGAVNANLAKFDPRIKAVEGTANKAAKIHGSEAFVEFLLPWICEQPHLDIYFIISDSSSQQKLKSISLQCDFTWLF